MGANVWVNAIHFPRESVIILFAFPATRYLRGCPDKLRRYKLNYDTYLPSVAWLPSCEVISFSIWAIILLDCHAYWRGSYVRFAQAHVASPRRCRLRRNNPALSSYLEVSSFLNHPRNSCWFPSLLVRSVLLHSLNTHFLWVGRVFSLALAGVPVAIIMKEGRWQSLRIYYVRFSFS